MEVEWRSGQDGLVDNKEALCRQLSIRELLFWPESSLWWRNHHALLMMGLALGCAELACGASSIDPALVLF